MGSARFRRPRAVATLAAVGLFGVLAPVTTASPASALGADDGRADLFVINRSDTGHTAIHDLDAASHFQTFTLSTLANLQDTSDPVWEHYIGDFNGDRVPDLYLVNRNDSGHTAIHVLNGADNYQTFLEQTLTPLLDASDPYWNFEVGDFNADGRSDLYAIYRNDQGHTAVHVLDAAHDFHLYTEHVLTPLGAATDPVWRFQVGDFDGDLRADLYAININDSGHTAVHVLSAASNFQTWTLHTLSALGAAVDPVWNLQVGDFDGDGRSDLYAINMNDQSRTAVHVLSATSNFQTYTEHRLTPLGNTNYSPWALQVPAARFPGLRTGVGGPLPNDDDEGVPVDGRSSSESTPASVTGIQVTGDLVADDSTNTIVSAYRVSGTPSQGMTRTEVGKTAAVYARSTTTGYTCVKDTKQGSGLKAYVPAHIDDSDDDWEIHYTDHLYSIDHARYVTGLGYTTQFEQCVIGGARNKHKYQRMAHTDSEVSITGGENRLLGYKWGTKVDDGAVTSSIDLKVDIAKTTSISGSLPVSSGGHEAGSIGEGLCGDVGDSSDNSGNQVNGAWDFTYPGFGTNDFKGNVSHALYEYGQPNKSNFRYYFQACKAARY